MFHTALISVTYTQCKIYSYTHVEKKAYNVSYTGFYSRLDSTELINASPSLHGLQYLKHGFKIYVCAVTFHVQMTERYSRLERNLESLFEFWRYVHWWNWAHWDSYDEGVRFESAPGYRSSWLKCFGLSMLMSGQFFGRGYLIASTHVFTIHDHLPILFDAICFRCVMRH
jgi:hypothetical protein